MCGWLAHGRARKLTKKRKKRRERERETRRGNSLALVSRELRAINTLFFPGKQCSDTGRKINEARAKFKLISILLFPLRLSSPRIRALSFVSLCALEEMCHVRARSRRFECSWTSFPNERYTRGKRLLIFALG